MTGFLQALMTTCFGQPSVLARPDEWTADRVDRAVALALCGSVEEARLLYRQTIGQEFAAYLLAHGQIGEGGQGAGEMRRPRIPVGAFDLLLDDNDRLPCAPPDGCPACRLCVGKLSGESWRAWYARMVAAEATP